jgi:hypothetical protein
MILTQLMPEADVRNLIYRENLINVLISVQT